MNTKELFGKEVLDANANSIGKVIDINFDIPEATIKNIIVKAGLTKKYVIGLDKIIKVGDKIVLEAREDELEKKS